MTLKDELKKLYEESEVAKRTAYFEKALPDRLRMEARNGSKSVTITSKELPPYIILPDIANWCATNKIDCTLNTELQGSSRLFIEWPASWVVISWA